MRTQPGRIAFFTILGAAACQLSRFCMGWHWTFNVALVTTVESP